MDDRVEPQMAADEATTLVEFLDYFRATVWIKVAGLDDEQARARSVPPSELCLMGIVRHLAEVERYWFQNIWLGTDAPSLFCTDTEPDLDLEPNPSSTMAEATAALAAEIAAARASITDIPLDRLSAGIRHDVRPNLRWILVHMIEEYSRHCGHADLLRQAIDGLTGD
ncbi:MAG: DinB family protein [Ilumatobacteraceae bacterium]